MPIWSFMLRNTEPEPESEQVNYLELLIILILFVIFNFKKPEKEQSRSHLPDNHPKEKTKRRYLNQTVPEADSSQKYNVSSWQIARNRFVL